MPLAPAILAKLRQLAARCDELTGQLAQPDAAASRQFAGLLRERGRLEHAHGLWQRFERLTARRAEAQRLLAGEAQGSDLAQLAREELAVLAAEEPALDEQVRSALISEPRDDLRKVILEIRAGVGGNEATLFARDLCAIYRRYFDARGWTVEDLALSPSEIGGFKDVVLAVEGEGVWRRLHSESGGHRVQRVPATEAQGRIHTSAATVAVLAEEGEVEIELRSDDLRIETMRAGGAGGQHVNKTESAVRVTHLPTGLVAICQDDRSQTRNRASALRLLKARVLELEQRRRDGERAAQRKHQVGSGDRSMRVRSYNWPQNRVTDHRLERSFPLEQVLAGRLDPLLDALLALEREQRIREL